MARVVIPAKTKKLVASGLTKLVADMDTLTIKNPAAIATFRSELTSAAQLLTGLSASLESLANQPSVSVSESTSQSIVQVNGKTISSSEHVTKVRRQQPIPAQQPQSQASVSKIPTGRGRKKQLSEPTSQHNADVDDVKPNVEANEPNVEANEPNGLLANKGHKRIRKPKK